MKQILCILAISLVIFSCQKTTPALNPATSASYADAWDSFRLHYNTFYHVVIKEGGNIDSSVCILLKVNDTFVEYKTTVDTNGLHLNDSAYFVQHSDYSELQKPDPNYYTTTTGYIFSRFQPLGGHNTSFHFHDYFVNDTFFLRIGVPTTFDKVVGSFRNARTDTLASVTIYQ